MKICLITEYFYPENSGGTPSVLSELSRYLQDHYDIEIDVITSNNYYRLDGRRLPSYENWDGINIHRISSPRSNRPSTVLRLLAGLCFSAAAMNKLRSMRPYDLILVGTNPPSAPIASVDCLKRTRTPYVYLIHDLYPDIAIAMGAIKKKSFVARLARNYQHAWLNSAAKVVVVGRCMKDHLEHDYSVPSAKISVITNWTDPENIFPITKSASLFGQKHHLDGFIALYAGNIGCAQGLDAIINAARLLRDSDSGITFVMVGDGSRSEEIADIISAEDLTNLQLFPAVCAADYPDLLACADVSIVSLAEGLHGLAVPSKIYTILASGHPVISVMDAGSEVSKVVKESACGLQVNQDDPERLADILLNLKNSPEQVSDMCGNARATLVEKYTLQKVADKFHEVFRESAHEPDRECVS